MVWGPCHYIGGHVIRSEAPKLNLITALGDFKIKMTSSCGDVQIISKLF